MALWVGLDPKRVVLNGLLAVVKSRDQILIGGFKSCPLRDKGLRVGRKSICGYLLFRQYESLEIASNRSENEKGRETNFYFFYFLGTKGDIIY